MRPRYALQAIIAIGLFGLTLSVALMRWAMLSGNSAVCPTSATRPLLGLPPGVYHSMLYFVIVVIAALGLGARYVRNVEQRP